jgi:hypothetical protein
LRPRFAPTGFISASGGVVLTGLLAATLATLASVTLASTFAALAAGLATSLVATLTGVFSGVLTGATFLETGTALTFFAGAAALATGFAAALTGVFATVLAGTLTFGFAGALALTGVALGATLAAGFVALAGAGLATGFALGLAAGLAATLATGLMDFLAPEGACALTGFFGFGAGMMNLNTANEHGKKTLRHKLLARDGMQKLTCRQVTSITRFLARCLGEHLGCSPCGSLAVPWWELRCGGGRVRRCCCRSCLEKMDYTHKGLKSSKNLSANQASTPLVQVTPTLKSRRVLGAFRVLQGGSFQRFQLVNQH